MSEIEKAIAALEKEKRFCNKMLKDLKEEEPFLDAEQDYAKGNSTAQCDCYDFIKGADIAITALREKMEREKGCEWCTTVDSATAYRRFYKNLFKGSDLVCIAQSIKRPDKFYLHIEMDDSGDGDCEITVCPSCGRKLVP